MIDRHVSGRVASTLGTINTLGQPGTTVVSGEWRRPGDGTLRLIDEGPLSVSQRFGILHAPFHDMARGVVSVLELPAWQVTTVRRNLETVFAEAVRAGKSGTDAMADVQMARDAMVVHANQPT